MANKIRHYAGFLMVAVYSCLGLLFLCTDIAIDTFPEYRKGIGATMLVYAGIRLLLTLKKLRHINEENQ